MAKDPKPLRKEYDVVVIGSGAAGLATAITAKLNGLDVIVIEKQPLIGGTTARAGGGFWIPCNPLQAKENIQDSPEMARAYIEYSAGNHYDAGRVEAFLKNGPEMIDFFEKNTALKFYVAPAYSDYHPHAKGALEGGRTCFPLPYDGRELGSELSRLAPPIQEMTFLGMHIGSGRDLLHFFNVTRSVRSLAFVVKRLSAHISEVVRYGRGMHLGNGAALVARFVRSALDLGIPLQTSTGAIGLIVEDGRVSGVSVQGPDGSGEIIARRGVVLACGGFPHDVERRKRLYKHAPTGKEHWSPTPKGNTGDGLRMAEAIGARTLEDYPNPAAWAPVSLVPRNNGKYGVFPHFVDRAKPGGIVVTRRGVRFTNEANSYHDFGQALVAACEGERDVCAFVVVDSKMIRKFGLGAVRPFPVPHGHHLRSGYLLKGRSLRELAGKAGIDAAALEKTAAEFNVHAHQGRDPIFHRGENAYNRYFGDLDNKPNPCVAPIQTGPFYAVKLVMGDLGSFAGLATDRHARVLDQARNPIPGLYAAGNDQASVFGGAYPGGGGTLGPAMTFGYIAGNHLAGKDTSEVA